MNFSKRSLRLLFGVVATAMAMLVFANRANAQSVSPARWQVELEVNTVAGLMSGGGSGQLPDPGLSFLTSSSNRPSRRVPSWFFGDGAKLLNDVLAETPAVAPANRLIPLDQLLTSSAVEARSVASVGFRAIRRLSSRYFVEMGFDLGQTNLRLSSETLDRVEATRASYASAFGALLNDPSLFINPNLTLTSDVRPSAGFRFQATAAFRVMLPEMGRATPYIVVGGGTASYFGDATVFTPHGTGGIRKPSIGDDWMADSFG